MRVLARKNEGSHEDGTSMMTCVRCRTPPAYKAEANMYA